MNFSERGANIDEMKIKRKRQKRKKQKQKHPVLLDHVQPGDALQPNLYSLITEKGGGNNVGYAKVLISF